MFPFEAGFMFRCDKARLDGQSSGLQVVVVEAFPKRGAAKLANFNPAASNAIVSFDGLHPDNSMRDALELQIVAPFHRAIVEQKHRAVAAGEMALDCKNL